MSERLMIYRQTFSYDVSAFQRRLLPPFEYYWSTKKVLKECLADDAIHVPIFEFSSPTFFIEMAEIQVDGERKAMWSPWETSS